MAGFSGYNRVGEVRDTGEAMYPADYIGAVFNAPGLVPFYGDGSKSISGARKFVLKNPGLTRESGTQVSRKISSFTPHDSGKIGIRKVRPDCIRSRQDRTDLACGYRLQGNYPIITVTNHLSFTRSRKNSAESAMKRY